ncbi:MAG: VanZ family protein [Chitinophagales bacterium]
MNSFWKYNWPPILWAAFILVLCLMPGKSLPSVSLWQFDKLVHFLFYIILAVLMLYGWRKQWDYPVLKERTIVRILVLTFAYGFLVEIMQDQLTDDRHFDIYDAIANAAGGIVGSLVGGLFIKAS